MLKPRIVITGNELTDRHEIKHPSHTDVQIGHVINLVKKLLWYSVKNVRYSIFGSCALTIKYSSIRKRLIPNKVKYSTKASVSNQTNSINANKNIEFNIRV